MHIVTLLLAFAALACFLRAAFAGPASVEPARVHWGWLGGALLTAAFIAQFTIVVTDPITIG